MHPLLRDERVTPTSPPRVLGPRRYGTPPGARSEATWLVASLPPAGRRADVVSTDLVQRRELELSSPMLTGGRRAWRWVVEVLAKDHPRGCGARPRIQHPDAPALLSRLLLRLLFALRLGVRVGQARLEEATARAIDAYGMMAVAILLMASLSPAARRPGVEEWKGSTPMPRVLGVRATHAVAHAGLASAAAEAGAKMADSSDSVRRQYPVAVQVVRSTGCLRGSRYDSDSCFRTPLPRSAGVGSAPRASPSPLRAASRGPRAARPRARWRGRCPR